MGDLIMKDDVTIDISKGNQIMYMAIIWIFFLWSFDVYGAHMALHIHVMVL